MSLLTRLPWRWRRFANDVLALPRRMKASRERQHRQHIPARDGIILDFGYPDLSEGLLHGGKVKLPHLANAFPCDPGRFNILYLVSSAPPPFAADYVRWAQQRGVVIVWNQNGVAYPGWAGGEAERFNAPMRELRAAADFVIYQSKFCRESARRFLGACDKPETVLLNPVDLERFRPAPAPPPSTPLRLLAAGTHGYRERVTAAIDCLGTLRAAGCDAVLTLAGRMDWRNGEVEVARYIRNTGTDAWIERVGAFSQTEAPDLYRRHHILIHPKYMDPCPTVVIEALACGLPVVGSASGGLPEMIPENCGKLLEVDTRWDELITPDGKAFAEAVLSIACDLDAFRANAVQHAAREFGVARWIERHRTVFERVLADNKNNQE